MVNLFFFGFVTLILAVANAVVPVPAYSGFATPDLQAMRRVEQVQLVKITDFTNASASATVQVHVRGRDILAANGSGVVLKKYMPPDFVGTVTAGNYNAVTNATATIGAGALAINSFPTTSKLVVGFRSPFTTIDVDVTNTNSATSTAQYRYFKTTDTWSTAANVATDGTASGTVTLAADGQIALFAQVPTDWRPMRRYGNLDFVALYGYPLYVAELSFTVALDSTVSLAQNGLEPLWSPAVVYPVNTVSSRVISSTAIADVNVIAAGELIYLKTTEADANASVTAGFQMREAGPFRVLR